MGWRVDEDELLRVRALDVDARYAYAINKASEQGELWTLASDDGWVVSRNPDGDLTIPVWPHERFAAFEATGEWADAIPERVALADDWLTERRAAWFEEHHLRVTVFLVGTSSMSVDYSDLADLLRGNRRDRDLPGKPGSGVARQPKRATRMTKDLVRYIRSSEVDLVIQRVPEEFRTRIGETFLRRTSDAKHLGSVTTRGRRDIDLATRLPVRVSLGRYLHGQQDPAEFGAPKVGQWPPWAVRRFLLYDVLLHEIGHLQIVDPKASRAERKFASETRAQEFADEIRRTLYSESFEHADPVHNAPTAAELSTLGLWERLDKAQRGHLVTLVLAAPRRNTAELARLGTLTNDQHEFLARVLLLERA
ncbi:MAG: DUF2750 domain-containing protein [Deltaproteobacteria bacterium]|nr:DUF2750 domain-containing protein [Deltaproteobacteria bacterium]MDQ3297681.1 DUF2750 domain-containing protein [Myxococcota bacterium]